MKYITLYSLLNIYPPENEQSCLSREASQVNCILSSKCSQYSSPLNAYISFTLSPWLYSGFPGDSDGTESVCNVGDPDSIPGSGRSPEKKMVTRSSILACKRGKKQYSCLFHGQRSLAGYCPWCDKESDMSEQLTHTINNVIFKVSSRNVQYTKM